jgi:hypothetical protein
MTARRYATPHRKWRGTGLTGPLGLLEGMPPPQAVGCMLSLAARFFHLPIWETTISAFVDPMMSTSS